VSTSFSGELSKLFETMDAIDSNTSMTPAERAARIKLQAQNHMLLRQLGTGNRAAGSLQPGATHQDQLSLVAQIEAALRGDA
jgi:hypothetical protein